jgi:hypothetical protein
MMHVVATVINDKANDHMGEGVVGEVKGKFVQSYLQMVDMYFGTKLNDSYIGTN